MAKHELHEIIAVENDRREAAKIAAVNLKSTFEKEKLFKGLTKSYQIFDENKQHLKRPTERQIVATTVQKELDYFIGKLAPFYNLSISKDATNATAKADIILNGEVFATDVPATALLTLEKELNKLVTVIQSIKVRDNSVNWIPAPEEGVGIFKNSDSTKRFLQETTMDYQAIDVGEKFKKEIKEVKLVKDVGSSEQVDFTSMLSTVEKADMLDRLNELCIAVKKARQVANRAEIVPVHSVGENLLNYVFNGAI